MRYERRLRDRLKVRGATGTYRAARATSGTSSSRSPPAARSGTFGRRSVIQLPVRLSGEARISVGDDVFVGAGSWLQVLGDAGSDAGGHRDRDRLRHQHRRCLRALCCITDSPGTERPPREERLHRRPHARLRGRRGARCSIRASLGSGRSRSTMVPGSGRTS